MSDTPRTCARCNDDCHAIRKKLETELATANKQADEARAAAIEDAISVLKEVNLHFSQVVENLRSLATAPAGHVCVSIDLLRFMCGECAHPNSGEWFGEGCESRGEAGAFWWRKYIIEMLAAHREGK